MSTVRVSGNVDIKHQLSAEVPNSIPPGPVTILIVPAPQEDDVGDAWMKGISEQWTSDLSDPSQDIYTLADGDPVRES